MTSNWSINNGFRSTRLAENLVDRGHSVLIRHVFVDDRKAWSASRPDLADDFTDLDEFDEARPDAIVLEGGLVEPFGDKWRVPEKVLFEFVNAGGAVLALDVGRAILGTRSAQSQLGFFGARFSDASAAIRHGGVPYMDDPEHSSDHTQHLLIKPDEMSFVDAWLKPTLQGIGRIAAWSAVPVDTTGSIAASATNDASVLVDDAYIDYFTRSFATVRQVGYGFAAIVTAETSIDEIVASNPDNVIWLANLVELLVAEGERQKRLRSSTPVSIDLEPASSLAALLEGGETARVEYKETFQFNIHTSARDEKIAHEVVRAVSGFLNSADGGTLLIGIDDDGQPRGLDRDFRLLGKKFNRDSFELRLRDKLQDSLSETVVGLVEIGFENVANALVCQVDVLHSPDPVFTKTRAGGGHTEYYIREGNRTRSLSGPSLAQHLKRR